MRLSTQRIQALTKEFEAGFGVAPTGFFSAPGRTEIGGNHTDHQRGMVLAAAVDLDMQAAVRENGMQTIRVLSKGYPRYEICLEHLTAQAEEVNTTPALIRGVAAGFARLGCSVRGFDMYMESAVLPGSGLSSSAAFEVLLGTVINHLFYEGKAAPTQVAKIGQYAENVFFGKPCGLMDQMASVVGGMVCIDFADDPVITRVDFDFAACGHALCIIDTRASHQELTGEYAAITDEMKAICRYFGKEVLREVPEEAFRTAIPQLRALCGDRAVLRAIHFYGENARVARQVAALQAGDFDTFLALVRESGRSSCMYLQNVIPTGATSRQEVALALALCQEYLGEQGAYRVHGGGFAGTVQAFVPLDLLDAFRTGIEAVFGPGACHILSIRKDGGVPVKETL